MKQPRLAVSHCSAPAPTEVAQVVVSTVPAGVAPFAGHGSRPFAWANPMIASLIDSMLRWVSAELRTSIWVESGIKAPASSRAMIATATASSTSEKPLLLLIAPGSGRNDHDPVVDRSGDARSVFEDQVCRRGILSFKIVREGPRAGLAVQRTAGEHQDRMFVVVWGREIVYRQASGSRSAGGAGTRQVILRDRIVGLAVPLVRSEPGDIWVGRACVGEARQIGRRRERNGDRDRAVGVPCVLQPPGVGDRTASIRPRHKAQCGRVWRTTDRTPLAE